MKISFENLKSLQDIKTSVLVEFFTEEYVSAYVKKNGSCVCGLKCKCGTKCDCEKYPLQEAYCDYEFNGSQNKIVSTGFNVSIKKNNIKKVFSVGLGKESILNNTELERIGYKVFQCLKSNNIKDVSFLFNLDNINDKFNYTDKIGKLSIKELFSHLIFGFSMAEYDFNKYKTQNKSYKLNNVICLVKNPIEYKEIMKSYDLIKGNVFYCRNLINEPANVVNPQYMANEAQKLTKLGVKVNILKIKDMEKLGMGSLLAVGQGSDKESLMVILEYNNSKKSKPLAFVGKGVCFDSGGLSLKPSSGMETMKCDMSGSAVVLSLIKLLAEREAKCNVVGVMPLVENMPSGKAVKVGDIVKSMSGQTIEVLNTDAEGRMILADALYYVASKYKTELIIDLATLTGAICVALGERYAGLFSNNDELSNQLLDAGKIVSENVWRMPISKLGGFYDKMIDSEFADMKNVGKRDGGAITASQFLQRFINNHPKWAHIDIAATAYVNSEGFLTKKNATGFGVRLLNELVKKYEN